MNLVIAEYLRTLKERDELDRLLPDLLLEMGYVPVARPQTGNRQYGVDIAARGKNTESGIDELMLLVVKQGDIGRQEWDGNSQAIMQSINDIFHVYLNSHVEPQDKNKKIRIVVATSGELKQTVQPSWTGFVSQNQDKAHIEFWGADTIAAHIEKYLLDEHIFLDEDRCDLRRALALSGDSEYDREDLHRLFLRALDLDESGKLIEKHRTGKAFLKSLRIVNLSAQAFSHWTLRDNGDSRQGLLAVERAMLWSWHRIQMSNDNDRNEAIHGPFARIWSGYNRFSSHYFARIQEHYFVKNSLLRYTSNGIETSIITFEQIGILASIVLFQFFYPCEVRDKVVFQKNAANIIDCLEAWIANNGVSNSPCFDRHSQDITLAMTAFYLMGRHEFAKEWLRKLFRNVDYAYRNMKYVPIATDSIDDLVDEGGWLGELATERMVEMSWMLPTFAGWTVILEVEDLYSILVKQVQEEYPKITLQLWHPEMDIYDSLYFQPAHIESGATEAPIHLPYNSEDYLKQIQLILDSEFGKVMPASPAIINGLPALDIIAYRHFSTPVMPSFWYLLTKNVLSEVE